MMMMMLMMMAMMMILMMKNDDVAEHDFGFDGDHDDGWTQHWVQSSQALSCSGRLELRPSGFMEHGAEPCLTDGLT